jgi:N-acetylglucosaminyl-diphospho-decaprenol L-rhamnosyltransferase
MKLLVVTVNYGSAQLVLDALDAVVAELRAIGDAQTWIVDNKSPDDSVAVLKKEIKKRKYQDCVRVIASDKNAGFGSGNNVAFREALALESPPEYFYLLNPDACPEAGAIQKLLSWMESTPAAAVAGGRLRYADGRDQCSTFRFPTLWSEVEHNVKLGAVTKLLHDKTVYMAPPDADCEVDWVSGASFIVRSSVLRDVGLFDETFFLYFEEVDLCRRIRAAGYQIWYIHDVRVTHINGATTGITNNRKRTPKYWFESREHYLRKAFGDVGLAQFNVVTGISFAVHRAAQLLRRRERDAPYFLRDFVKFTFRRR